MTAFKVGDKVRISWDKKATGVVTKVYNYAGSPNYDVRWNDLTCTHSTAGWSQSLEAIPDELPRVDILKKAIDVISKDRNNVHGPPSQDFVRIAELLQTLGFRFIPNEEKGDILDISAHHVAMFAICLKLSRMTWNPENEDNWLDIAGYAACGWETVKSADTENN